MTNDPISSRCTVALLAAGYWPLVTDYWLLTVDECGSAVVSPVTDCWLLVTGCYGGAVVPPVPKTGDIRDARKTRVQSIAIDCIRWPSILPERPIQGQDVGRRMSVVGRGALSERAAFFIYHSSFAPRTAETVVYGVGRSWSTGWKNHGLPLARPPTPPSIFPQTVNPTSVLRNGIIFVAILAIVDNWRL